MSEDADPPVVPGTTCGWQAAARISVGERKRPEQTITRMLCVHAGGQRWVKFKVGRWRMQKYH